MTRAANNPPSSVSPGDPDAAPYFLWDDPMTVSEVRARLRDATPPERARLLGRIMREARDTEVWDFTSPEEIARLWPEVRKNLGKRRPFWEFLLGQWRKLGLLGASIERVRTAPDFRRHVLRRPGETLVVDLVRERVSQIRPDKPILDGVRVDPPEEIFANKLCTLLSRSEVRDLVDVRALEGVGLDLDAGLAGARLKDGGLTAAQLAWVLSEIDIGDDARVPGNVTVPELRAYLADLVTRLAKRAHPKA